MPRGVIRSGKGAHEVVFLLVHPHAPAAFGAGCGHSGFGPGMVERPGAGARGRGQGQSGHHAPGLKHGPGSGAGGGIRPRALGHPGPGAHHPRDGRRRRARLAGPVEPAEPRLRQPRPHRPERPRACLVLPAPGRGGCFRAQVFQGRAAHGGLFRGRIRDRPRLGPVGDPFRPARVRDQRLSGGRAGRQLRSGRPGPELQFRLPARRLGHGAFRCARSAPVPPPDSRAGLAARSTRTCGWGC